jgi:hypothetical protein
MKVAAYTDNEGNLCILIPATNIHVPDKETLERADFMPYPFEGSRLATEEEIALRDCPFPFNMVEADTIPQDRYFRSAWKWDSGVKVDMPKAREIHMGHIRYVRDTALEKLDIEQLKGNDVQAQKQALRDLPQNIDLNQYTTPETLKAFWPANLTRPE